MDEKDKKQPESTNKQINLIRNDKHRAKPHLNEGEEYDWRQESEEWKDTTC